MGKILLLVLLTIILLSGGCTLPSTETLVPGSAEEPISTPDEASAPATELPASTEAPTATLTPTETPSPTLVPTPSTSLLTIDATGERASYRSDDINISGYFYRPAGIGPFPAVLVLHGSNGLGEGPRAYAAWLASQGYVALTPDYLTPIGVPTNDWSASDWMENPSRILKYLVDGVEAIKTSPYVIPNRIAVVGFSFGGYFAFILAGSDDVKCITSYYGAYFGKPVRDVPAAFTFSDIVAQIKVPVLMLHGDADQRVPIALADAVQDLLATNNKQFEYIIYPGAGHSFDVQGSPTYNAEAAIDAQQKTLAFLREKLQ